MDVDIELKNYRCFADTHPARFTFNHGLTAFVGANNSGKSSLLKFFYEFRDLFARLSGPTGNFAQVLTGKAEGFGLGSTIVDNNEIFHDQNDRDLEVHIRFTPSGEDHPCDTAIFPNRLDIIVRRGTNQFTLGLNAGDIAVKWPSHNISALQMDGALLRIGTTTVVDLAPLYDVCKLMTDTLYVGAFRNAINLGSNERYFDMEVGQKFIRFWRDLKSGAVKKDNEACYKLTQNIRRIFRYDGLEINPSANEQSLQMIINGRSYGLSELGSGLAHFIVVLANVAKRAPSYLLIDEPELGLHPSLQLEFLTTLASYCGRGVLFATHSVGLARAIAPRVYTVRRTGDEGARVEPYEGTARLAEFLGELSYASYRDVGFEKLLLVEGPSEVKTLQQLLRSFGKDHKVVLLPLGGGSMINGSREDELIEIKRISDDVAALIDSERSKPNEELVESRQAFMETCARVGIRCHALVRRAIENYFPDAAVKKVKGPKYRSLTPYERLTDPLPSWSKEENWRIAREMEAQELGGTDLGDFLTSL